MRFLTLTLLLALPCLAAPPPDLVHVPSTQPAVVGDVDLPGVVTLAAGEALPVDPLAEPQLPPGLHALEGTPVQAVTALLDLARAGKWLAFAMALLFLAVKLLRFGAKKLPPTSKVATALNSTWGGWATNFVSAVSAGFASYGVLGVPLTLPSVLTVVGGGVAFALGGAGLHELIKDLTQARNEKAAEAGATAAAGVNTVTDAADIFRGKGPTP